MHSILFSKERSSAARRSKLGPNWSFLATLLDRLQPPEQAVLLATALVVGLGAGLGAVVFRWLINTVRTFAFSQMPQWLGFLGQYYIILIPALGGLVIGPMIYLFAREAKGHGVPEVMEAVALRGGRIRPIVAVVKSLASSICIGTGGSVGREGPIVQIGSALGSTIGQMLHLSDERVRNLVACGAAGGIAATFNAPIAGVFFALEVILGEFSVANFSTVVVAAVTASVVGQAVFGNVPAFLVPAYALVDVREFLLYAILGCLSAVACVAFVRLLYRSEDLFDAWHFPEWLKPAVGGLLLGIIGLWFPQVFGVGYKTISGDLLGQIAVGTAIVLLIVKVVATSLTLGSGGSGGVFAPSLFMGSALGAAFGLLVHQIWPGITAGPGAYALVGMSAFFAGAAQAPITAVIMLFEMTGDYRIILPLMLATVLSTVLARHLLKDQSVYTLKLTRRGIRLKSGRDIDVMQGITVGEVMTVDLGTVNDRMTVRELADLFSATHHHGFPVMDDQGHLVGIVTIQDLELATQVGRPPGLRVRDIMTPNPLVAYPDEAVWSALKRLGVRDVGRLPVVDRQSKQLVLGVIRRSDIVRAYHVAMTQRVELEHRTEQLRLGKVSGTEFIEAEVRVDSPMVSQPIKALSLPRECVIVSIRRGRGLVFPHGDTIIQTGDRVTALVDVDCLEDFRALFGDSTTEKTA